MNLLTLAGRPTKIDLSAKLTVFEFNVGRAFKVGEKGGINVYGGLAKVFDTDIKLKSGLTTFESTQAGQNLMRQSESDLEKIVNDQGISPTLGIDYVYSF